MLTLNLGIEVLVFVSQSLNLHIGSFRGRIASLGFSELGVEALVDRRLLQDLHLLAQSLYGLVFGVDIAGHLEDLGFHLFDLMLVCPEAIL